MGEKYPIQQKLKIIHLKKKNLELSCRDFIPINHTQAQQLLLFP